MNNDNQPADPNTASADKSDQWFKAILIAFVVIGGYFVVTSEPTNPPTDQEVCYDAETGPYEC